MSGPVVTQEDIDCADRVVSAADITTVDDYYEVDIDLAAQEIARHREASVAAAVAEIAKLQEIVRTQAEEAAKATYYYTDKMDEMKKECDALAGALERILDGGYVSEQIEEERFDYLTARAALAKHKGEA